MYKISFVYTSTYSDIVLELNELSSYALTSNTIKNLYSYIPIIYTLPKLLYYYYYYFYLANTNLTHITISAILIKNIYIILKESIEFNYIPNTIEINLDSRRAHMDTCLSYNRSIICAVELA